MQESTDWEQHNVNTSTCNKIRSIGMKTIFVTLIFLSLFSCSERNTLIVELGFQKDLIPEGIAVDSHTGTVYLNSLRHGKIVASKHDGSNPADFIGSNQYGYLPGFGMTIKGDTLFALGNGKQGDTFRSVLLLLDLKTGDSIASFSISDTTLIYWNDLAVCSCKDIFVTESESNRIYKIPYSTGIPEVFIESNEILHSNGIAVSSDNKYLYAASEKGIRVIDIQSREILNEAGRDNAGIDGLKYYRNSLFGMVNGWADVTKNGMHRFYLNDEGTAIVKKEKIIPYGENFQIPTTFDLVDNTLYFVINTQLDNLDEGNKIVDPGKLKNYLLMIKRI